MKLFEAVPVKVRGCLLTFAALMEAKLQENDHKGGWKECSSLWLQTKLTEEVGELGRLLVKLHAPEGAPYMVIEANEEDVKAAMRECADVANVAMMIADVLSERVRG